MNPRSPPVRVRKEPEKGPQLVVLEQCVSQLFKAIPQELGVLQRYFLVLGIGDPTIVRGKGNINALLGEFVESAKACSQGLTLLVKNSPNTLCDELKQNSDWGMYLFAPLAERVTLFDLLQKNPSLATSSVDHRRCLLLGWCRFLLWNLIGVYRILGEYDIQGPLLLIGELLL